MRNEIRRTPTRSQVQSHLQDCYCFSCALSSYIGCIDGNTRLATHSGSIYVDLECCINDVNALLRTSRRNNSPRALSLVQSEYITVDLIFQIVPAASYALYYRKICCYYYILNMEATSFSETLSMCIELHLSRQNSFLHYQHSVKPYSVSYVANHVHNFAVLFDPIRILFLKVDKILTTRLMQNRTL